MSERGELKLSGDPSKKRKTSKQEGYRLRMINELWGCLKKLQ